MSQGATKGKREPEPFDIERPYLQFLRRKKRKGLWSPRWYWIPAILLIGPAGLMVLALLSPVFNIPRIINDDERNGTLHALFLTPVPTSAIVQDIRRWIFETQGWFLALIVFIVLLINFTIWIMNPSALMQMLLETAIDLVFLPVFCLLLLNTAIIMASFPDYPTMPLVIGLIWLLPVLVGIFAGAGPFVSFIHALLGFETEPSTFLEILFACTILAAIPAYIAHCYAPWFMDLRRSGRWG